MSYLALLDVDGTILNAQKTPGRRSRFEVAVHKKSGKDVKIDFKKDGLTDYIIMGRLLKIASISDPPESYFEALHEAFMENLGYYDIRQIPHITDLLCILRDCQVIVGLATGNIHATADVKLARAGLTRY